MAGFWGKKKVGQDAAVSADFHRELTREMMRTELIRVKALIATTVLLGIVLGAVNLLAPEAVSRVWHGNLRPAYLYAIIIPFILFELTVHAVVSRDLRLDHDVPVVGRISAH